MAAAGSRAVIPVYVAGSREPITAEQAQILADIRRTLREAKARAESPPIT